jgi:hypothetical protein
MSDERVSRRRQEQAEDHGKSRRGRRRGVRLLGGRATLIAKRAILTSPEAHWASEVLLRLCRFLKGHISSQDGEDHDHLIGSLIACS